MTPSINRLVNGRSYITLLCVATLLATLLVSSIAHGDDSGMKISGSVDTLGQWGLGETGSEFRKVYPREAEAILFGPVDHTFDGVLSMAAHQENGQTLFELHEGYISSSKLIPRSRLKFGQHFLGVGRLNRFHRHDWPFASTPIIHEKFLDEEGVVDSGLEWSWLTPLPFFLDLTMGFGSGYTFGHTHSAGFKPKVPTLYIRPATFIEMGTTQGIELGFTSLYRNDNSNNKMTLLGLDFTLKDRENKTLRMMLQTEFWFRHLSSTSTSNEWGAYVYPHLGLSSQWSIGTRLDAYKIVTADGYQIAAVPTITYQNSEFARFRLEYNHKVEKRSSGDNVLTPVFTFQTTLFLGAHPAHDF